MLYIYFFLTSKLCKKRRLSQLTFAVEISFGIVLFSTGTLQGQNERHLLHFLFVERHYNPLERPVANESKPIIVKFGITLQQIIDIVSNTFKNKS